MPSQRGRGGLAAVIGLALVAGGCATRPMLVAPPTVEEIEVTPVGDDCTLDKPYAEVWWNGSSSQKLEVRWVFLMDPRWYGEVKALPATEQSPSDPEGEGRRKLKLFKLKYSTKSGLLVASGRPRDRPQKTSAGEWPRWRYKVTIWDKGLDTKGDPIGPPKCGTDPGVCVRGGGGACEI